MAHRGPRTPLTTLTHRTQLRLSLSSFRTAEPHEQASALLAYLTHEPAVSPSQLEDAAAGAGVTAAAVQELATELWEVAHVEAMAVGNVRAALLSCACE